jgi:D-lyxose ketol-isomerase
MMMTQEQATAALLEILQRAHIVITAEEVKVFSAWGWWLNDYEHIGSGGFEYANTPRYCGREIVLLPWQILPEHLHPYIDENNPGKEEMFRCRYGVVYIYVPGEPTPNPHGHVPEHRKEHFTVWHEIVLHPGEQYTLPPNTRHWFQAGPDGAVFSEFSSFATNDRDIYTDPEIQARQSALPKKI